MFCLKIKMYVYIWAWHGVNNNLCTYIEHFAIATTTIKRNTFCVFLSQTVFVLNLSSSISSDGLQNRVSVFVEDLIVSIGPERSDLASNFHDDGRVFVIVVVVIVATVHSKGEFVSHLAAFQTVRVARIVLGLDKSRTQHVGK